MTQSTSSLKLGSCTPGTVILYREAGSARPLWPSVYLPDDAAPKPFLRTRPSRLYSIVLKLANVADTSHLRWALTSQMLLFDPYAADDTTKRSTPGLEDAYTVALDALEAQFDLNYWKAIVASCQIHEPRAVDSDEDDFDSDPEMQQAIKMGIIHAGPQKTRYRRNPPASQTTSLNGLSGVPRPHPRASKPHRYDRELSSPVRRHPQPNPRLLTPTPSPPRKSSVFSLPLQSLKRPSPPSPTYSDDDLPSPSQQRKLSGDLGTGRATGYLTSSQSTPGACSMPFILSDDDDLPSPPRRRKSSTAKLVVLQSPARKPKEAAAPPLSAQQVFLRNGLNAPALTAPDDDVIEEDLDDSNQFVQIFIGPETDPTSNSDIDPQRRKYKLQLLKHHVWNRPYFRDTLSARNYIEPIGDNTWELVHPRLVEISPDDFRWAAEFLSDGDFGHREPETEGEVADTFAQCVSAWRTAELLCMDDLLEHIVNKIRASQPWWDLWNVMAFAVSIYKSEVSLQAHDELKALFSEYIASLFHLYLKDDHLSRAFLDRLQQLPELERNILVKRVAQLERPVQPSEGEAVAEEEEEDTNMDLYE